MPITDKNAYPENWETEIRPAILKRAEYKCEWCQKANYLRYWDHPHEDCWHVTTTDAKVAYRWYGRNYMKEQKRVVLTIAHVHDPNPSNCDHENLAALCQTCHNNHDIRMRHMNIVRRKNSELEAAGQLRLL